MIAACVVFVIMIINAKSMSNLMDSNFSKTPYSWVFDRDYNYTFKGFRCLSKGVTRE